jgi:neural Wiskott-Aldrich syndrome protein
MSLHTASTHYASTISKLASLSSTTMSIEPPPTYSQQDISSSLESGPQDPPQILIVPPSGGVSFQKGFLGADGERAAIEGEILIKGANATSWKRV